MERKILAELLKCWVFDVDTFINIYEKCEDNNLFFLFEEIEANYGGIITINACISEWLYLLVEWFLKKYKTKIENLLNIWDLERYREENEIYEIWAEWVGSSVTFFNEKIDSLFVNSEFYFK